MGGVIYMYTSPSGKSYIGQTWDEKKRRNEHKCYHSNQGGVLLHKAMKKYGYENIQYCLLHENIETQDELNFLEQKEITDRNTLVPNGYNLTTGGSKGKAYSEETKQKLSEALTGHETSDETRAKIAAKLKGKSYVTAEGRKRISERHKGRILNDSQLSQLTIGRNKPRSQEARERSNKALREYILTDEDKQKRRERMLGSNNPFYGRSHSEETKRKISETKRRNRENERT